MQPTANTVDKLREEIIKVQLESLKLTQEGMRSRLESRLDTHAADIADHEKRLRFVEDSAVKFNFILYLTMGGGLIGILNLGIIVFSVIKP